MVDWDPECRSYLCCLFGCEVWGGDSALCLSEDPVERYNWLLESRAIMFSAGITREQRCTLEKCNAYCAKKAPSAVAESDGKRWLHGSDARCESSSGDIIDIDSMCRQVFMTCRETQYTQQCERSNPRLYGCDVDCHWDQGL